MDFNYCSDKSVSYFNLKIKSILYYQNCGIEPPAIYNIQAFVAPVNVNAPVGVNVGNNESDRTSFCQRSYNNGTVSVNVDCNGCIRNCYCQR